MKPKIQLFILLLIATLSFNNSLKAKPVKDDQVNSITTPQYVTPYDSVSMKIDSLRASDGRVGTVQRTIDYYKKINGKMTIVERHECRDKSLSSERTDCWIYRLKDGELKMDEFMGGAE